MKKKIYVIIGHGACGKSSLVRSLTGVARKKQNVKIKFNNDKIEEFSIWIRSSQEDWKFPKDVIIELSASPNGNILLTLRLHTLYKRPKGIEYLKLIDASFDIEKIAVIGERIDVKELAIIESKWGKKVESFQNSWSRPMNELSSEVREHFKWV